MANFHNFVFKIDNGITKGGLSLFQKLEIPMMLLYMFGLYIHSWIKKF